ncbi:MAG: family 1 glycosylhydrolase, partial [Pseudomonadota bacterium]|nr:family 1 glycosylhydrolase [Pseudomonadota bacterium]
MSPGPCEALELWAGPECSVVRVGEQWRDQLKSTGHAGRLSDLDAIASIGAKKIRYPVLWEHVAPDSPELCDWSWADARLERIRSLGLAPIVGLIHHGSGPSYTDLLDSALPVLLAGYAARVAERYPWVEYYTPVNEPLTTARFSGLYGLWHPHEKNDRAFVRALLNECRGTVLAMGAIRKINPAAKLVQTEDIGYVFSTPHLARQAAFENQRRWLSFDLLCGWVTKAHPLWRYLRRSGASCADLEWFQKNPCPPDIIGANYYITSERFLDHRTEHYPEGVIGGNGKDIYADIEAVRVLAAGTAGLERLLSELWSRYRIPIAVTEAHIGCTREEQLRWLAEIWQGATAARDQGADIRAVTLWSVFGAHDWNSL